MESVLRLVRWAGWAMLSLGLAFIAGIPLAALALGAGPDVGSNLPALLMAGAAGSAYALFCIICWTPIALWVSALEKSWIVLVPSFLALIVLIGQLTAITLNFQDYSPVPCALGSLYSALAVLAPRYLSRGLGPGCFLVAGSSVRAIG